MKQMLSTLLATDDMTRQHGCRLKPALRAAIEADLRYPAHATAPASQEVPDNLPENAVTLTPATREPKRGLA